MKPVKGNFQIQLKGGELYGPDFVVEAADCRYLVEVKRRDHVSAPEVLIRADAARVWCKHATDFTKTTDGKPWRHLLVPDDVIQENMELAFLAREFGN